MFEMMLVDPTSANLPFWSIGVLVAAVAGLFSILLKLMNDANQERKELQIMEDKNRQDFQERLDALYKESLEDQKKMAVLLNDNIQLIQSLTNEK